MPKLKLPEFTCDECKLTKHGLMFTCPSCGGVRCWMCWDRHITAKVCVYGAAKVIEVEIPERTNT